MIKVYSTMGCGKCTMLKNALKKSGLEYEEKEDINVSSFPTMEIEDGTRMTLLEAFKWIDNQNKNK